MPSTRTFSSGGKFLSLFQCIRVWTLRLLPKSPLSITSRRLQLRVLENGPGCVFQRGFLGVEWSVKLTRHQVQRSAARRPGNNGGRIRAGLAHCFVFCVSFEKFIIIASNYEVSPPQLVSHSKRPLHACGLPKPGTLATLTAPFSGYAMLTNRDGLHHNFGKRDITIRPITAYSDAG